MVYGSGLRSDLVCRRFNHPNGAHVPPTPRPISASRTRSSDPDGKPITVRFDVVNVFDTVYEIRDGSGIGVFAPQFGERRGFFVGVSKKL